MVKSSFDEIYESLGATPIINAIGSVTMLGGSTVIPEVSDAMGQANNAYTPLLELQEKAGEMIADLVNVPAAYVTSGAGSALTLATAAVMAGKDDKKIEQLPDTTGMKNEILIQKRQRYWYDRCLELAGAKLVEFGSAQKTLPEDLFNSIGPNTAAVHYFVSASEEDAQNLSLEQTIEIAHARDIPVLVDAAGQVYPLDNIGAYVRMGADFQCVATKYINAPQSTGLALGSCEMIRNISYQSFVGYEGRRVRGIGRPHKVDRQEIVGATVALRHWLSMNHEERLSRAEKQSRTIFDLTDGIEGLDVEMYDNILGHQPFGLKLSFDSELLGSSASDVVNKLKEGSPSIWTRVRPGEDFIVIHTFGLKNGEDKIVGERIAEILSY